MSGSETEDWECPLCMEELDIDDRGFFPCECGYQICRFCHNRLSEDYGGRCPACRRLYSEQTPRWNPISPAQVAKIKNEKRAKERERREIESNSRRHLANVRVVQKNLVYVIGLPSSLATEDILRSQDYFGQFGRINKIVINRRQNGSNSHHPTVGVYVTYASRDEATRAINAVDGSMLESRVLRATFGTTKYCSYYLRNIPCQNPGCMYLHEPGEEADSFTKEDLAANRANLRESRGGPFDHGDDDDDDDDDDLSDIDESRSPNAGANSGRLAAAATAGQHPGRSHSTMPAGLSSGNHAAGASTAASRVRKSSEISGLRPRSVDPHGNDSQTGSALPATASWASRAVAKKPAESADSKARKIDASGPMTLRMVPASRGKAAKATGSVAAPVAATTPATRERTKSTAVPLDTAPAATATAAAATSPNAAQHHPVLQQMSRERKQQLRHQNRTQQKAAELATVAAEASASEKAPAAQTKQSQKAAKKAEALREAEKVQQESIASTAAAADVAAAAAAEPSLPSKRSAGPKVKPESAATEAVPLQPVEDAETAAMPVAEAAKVDLPPAAPEEIGPSVLAEDANASGARPAVSYANGALSFQTITDSLFAQLNAKVSTPATNSAMPTFAGTQALGGHAGIRAPGFPISGVDPLLFSTSATNDPAASGRLGGPFDAPSQFSLFGSQAPTQWGEPGPANGPYTQTPLSSLLADSNPLGPPIGVSREMSVGSGSGSSSRQRSRWDFAHVDEASAQAELQSVLGRSAGPPIGALGQQPVHGPAATSFASSRDLGMFSTPVRGGGGYMSNGPWGSIPPQQQHHQHQQGVAPAPFPPPGFGSKQSSGTLHTESSPMAAFGPGVHGGNQSIAPGSSALLSKLMGQQHQMPALGDDGVMLHNAGFPPHQQMQQHQMQDPAIMMSQMVPTGTGTPGSSGSDQQRGRADPNVLNSLLARLHLSRGDSDPAFQRTPSGDQLAYSHTIAGSQQVSGMLPPGMMPAGAVVSPVYSGHPQHSPLSTLQAQLSAGSSGSGFVDPAIMNIGRLNVRGNSTAASSTGPSSPIGLPPGIASPGIKSPVSGDNSALAAPGQTRMLPRSANSSGRSRFLNHFSAETDNQKQQPPPISEAAAAAAAEPSNTGRSGTSSVAEHEEGGATMVNGVPPGLPTTGLFGELLRRAKQDSLSSSAAATVPSASAPSYGGGDSSAFISGKMMLGDIERKLEAARREAQELQAQLSTVIGQNQTAMRVLANGSTPAASAAGDPAASATM